MKGHSNLWWWKWTWRRVPQLCEVQLEAPTLTVIYLHHLMSPSYFSVPFPSQPWMLKLQVQSDKDDIYFHIIIILPERFQPKLGPQSKCSKSWAIQLDNINELTGMLETFLAFVIQFSTCPTTTDSNTRSGEEPCVSCCLK